jgi:RNA polymerase sigma factor (TIGR02999 family)
MSDSAHSSAQSAVGIDDAWQLMGDLRRMARSLLARESDAHSVRATALICSALCRQKGAGTDWRELQWKNRDAFFAETFKVMRRVLVDRARRRKAARRPRIKYLPPEGMDPFYNLPTTFEAAPEKIVALEEALRWLEIRKPDHASAIQLHYFAGLLIDEIATFLNISEKTARRRLAEARLLLHKRIAEWLAAG